MVTTGVKKKKGRKCSSEKERSFLLKNFYDVMNSA